VTKKRVSTQVKLKFRGLASTKTKANQQR